MYEIPKKYIKKTKHSNYTLYNKLNINEIKWNIEIGPVIIPTFSTHLIFNDKFNYDNINYPAGLEDIETFEHNNKISVFVYAYSDNDENIYGEYMGNPSYINNDIVNVSNDNKQNTKLIIGIYNINYIIKKIDI